MKKNVRKFDRFEVELPVRLLKDPHTQGRMVDISQEGCLIVFDQGKQITVGTHLILQVFMDKLMPAAEVTSPKTDLAMAQGDVQRASKLIPRSSDAEVRLAGEVVRYAPYKGKEGLGVRIHALEEQDMQRWLDFLQNLHEEHVFGFGLFKDLNLEYEKKNKTPKVPFTVRFPKISTLMSFLPDKPDEVFFVPTKTSRPPGTHISLTLVHPKDQRTRTLYAIVEDYGPHPTKKHKIGLHCRFDHTEDEVCFLINDFMEKKIYVSTLLSRG